MPLALFVFEKPRTVQGNPSPHSPRHRIRTTSPQEHAQVSKRYLNLFPTPRSETKAEAGSGPPRLKYLRRRGKMIKSIRD